MEWITSRKNPLLTQIRKLASGSAGTAGRRGSIWGTEGKLLEEALEVARPPHHRGGVGGGGAPRPAFGGAGGQVPRDVMETISPLKTPQGALFLVRLPETRPPETLTGDRYLVLDGVQDPGNVGTIWRTADALGADGLILVGNCADPYSPKVVRSSMGACFRLPVHETDAGGLCALLERSGIPLSATALREDTVSWSRHGWTGRRWSSAVRGAGSPRSSWPAADRPSRSPCGRGANP